MSTEFRITARERRSLKSLAAEWSECYMDSWYHYGFFDNFCGPWASIIHRAIKQGDLPSITQRDGSRSVSAINFQAWLDRHCSERP